MNQATMVRGNVLNSSLSLPPEFSVENCGDSIKKKKRGLIRPSVPTNNLPNVASPCNMPYLLTSKMI